MSASPLRCALCHDQLAGVRHTCDGCGTSLHVDCQATLAECPTLGCERRLTSSAPAAKPRGGSWVLQAMVLLLVAGAAWAAGTWSRNDDDWADYDWNEEAFDSLEEDEAVLGERDASEAWGKGDPARTGSAPKAFVSLGGEAYCEALFVRAVERLQLHDLGLDSAAELLLVLALAPTSELALDARAYLDWLVAAWHARLIREAAEFGQRNAVLALCAGLPQRTEDYGLGSRSTDLRSQAMRALEERVPYPWPLVTLSGVHPEETFVVDVRQPALHSRETMLSFLFAEALRQRPNDATQASK